MRHFCTEGPVREDLHYAIPPLERIDLERVLELLEQQRYFVLHAPRQSGKTSVMRALVKRINASGPGRAVYINVEAAQPARNDVLAAMRVILWELAGQATLQLGDAFVADHREETLRAAGENALNAILGQWARTDPRPLVVIIDEIDSLVGDSLIAVLRQIRSGYPDRPMAFPSAVILCGVRDVRDYRIHGGNEIITGGSAFNIKAESLRIGNFTTGEIARLYAMHTRETGQRFDDDAIARVWELTLGQPWLVNALAGHACFRLERDRERTITCAHIDEAREHLIVERPVHLDQLADKLREPRVRRIVQPILTGDDRFGALEDEDDLRYAVDLGLVRRGESSWEIANPIYRETIPRSLTHIMQSELPDLRPRAWYLAPGGSLDIDKLLASFQEFFRENSEIWLAGSAYPEAAPQLLLQAFLQRIVNGGGRIDREYALGRRRIDLLVVWKYAGGAQRSVIEIKLVRGSLDRTVAEGLRQIAGYMESTACAEGHLVVFDRDPGASWDAKIFRREQTLEGGRTVIVWGM